MKKLFLFLWVSLFSLAQNDEKTIKEIDFSAESHKCYQNYIQKLNDNNKLYPPKTAYFKSVYIKNGEEIPFNGTLEYEKTFTIKDIKFNEAFSKEEQEFYRRFLGNIHKVLYSYHLFAANKQHFLEKFYCQYNEAEQFYTFRIIDNKMKQSLKLREEKKANFSIWLNHNGIVDKIKSSVDKKEYKQHQDSTNIYDFTLLFTSYKQGVKFHSVKGETTNIKTNNSIIFDINFN